MGFKRKNSIITKYPKIEAFTRLVLVLKVRTTIELSFNFLNTTDNAKLINFIKVYYCLTTKTCYYETVL